MKYILPTVNTQIIEIKSKNAINPKKINLKTGKTLFKIQDMIFIIYFDKKAKIFTNVALKL